MNICFICDEYPPVSHGGIGTVTKSIAEELVNQNHKVCVIGLLPKSYGGKAFEIVNKVKIWRVHHGVKVPLLSRSSLLYKALNKVLKIDFIGLDKAWLAHNKLIKKIVEENEIDIVEFPDYRLAFSHLKLKSNLWPEIKIPKIVKFHGSFNYFNIEASKDISNKEHFYEKELYRYSNQLVSVSHYTKNKMISYYNLNQPIEVLHNGLEIVSIQPKAKENSVIFSGSLLPKKGIIPLLKAWNKVCEHNDKVVLKLYGKGVKERFTKYIYPKYKNRVLFLGHTTKNHLLEEYSKSLLAIFPSFAEAFALAPMESMMVGCPTIYSNTTSGSELQLDKEALFLIDPNFEEEISNLIIELIDNEPLRDKTGIKGKNLIVEQFSISKIVENHLELFNKLIK